MASYGANSLKSPWSSTTVDFKKIYLPHKIFQLQLKIDEDKPETKNYSEKVRDYSVSITHLLFNIDS